MRSALVPSGQLVDRGSAMVADHCIYDVVVDAFHHADSHHRFRGVVTLFRFITPAGGV